MTTIGFLACETTLPGTGLRRGDAYEHDLMIAALEPALRDFGMALRVVDWEAPLAEFGGLELVMLGTAWNYQDRADEFLDKLEALAERGIAVCNPPEIVRWNMTKTYLRELAERGVDTIPTRWLDRVTAQNASAVMDEFDCDKLVVKRQVGAGALGQELLEKGSIPRGWHFDQPAMLQPFLPAIAEDGELSFVFIDGELSHALRKVPAPDDYRIQSLYGGTERVHNATEKEQAAAQAVLDALPFAPSLYARIDMLRGTQGGLKVMEVELIEPYLYPEQGPQLGARLARAIAQKVSRQ